MYEDDIAKYRTLLNSHDHHMRLTAIIVLRHCMARDAASIREAVRLLETDDALDVRREAVRYLAELRETSLVAVLTAALCDDDYIVRGEAFLGIVSILPAHMDKPEVAKFISGETHPFCRWCIREA